MTVAAPAHSLCLPSFAARLADPAIRSVLLCGCGGGFDFVHGLTLYQELRRLGKTVVIGSYSFGAPEEIGGLAEVVFSEQGVIAKRVSAANLPARSYAPEVHLCSFLDTQEPDAAPHYVYAYYARSFSVPRLRSLYQQLIDRHAVDAVILIDGGSDSLMRGDEEGLGDPIEDAVSVAAVASLPGLRLKLLVCLGLGADRYNQVSDAASLRAVAELTAQGGFLGAVSLEPQSPSFHFYRQGLEHIYARHGERGFRSVVAGTIVSAVEGWFGRESVPPLLQKRVRPGESFIWPLMAVLWTFDVEVVARRSLVAQWLRDCTQVDECYAALYRGRAELGEKLRSVEELPRHTEMRR